MTYDLLVVERDVRSPNVNDWHDQAGQVAELTAVPRQMTVMPSLEVKFISLTC